MHDPVRIWLEVAHHQAFRVGGWAFVRQQAGEAAGTAGGERRVGADWPPLAGLVAALRELPPGTAVELHTASPAVLALPRRIAAAEAGEDAPTDNLELWAQAATALRRLEVRMRRIELGPRGAGAFAAAWAELARDRAKDQGGFSRPIPKPNLAKAGL